MVFAFLSLKDVKKTTAAFIYELHIIDLDQKDRKVVRR